MKYANEWGEPRTLVADRRPFRGVENHFIDSILYQYSLKISMETNELDSGNKVDEVLELDDVHGNLTYLY